MTLNHLSQLNCPRKKLNKNLVGLIDPRSALAKSSQSVQGKGAKISGRESWRERESVCVCGGVRVCEGERERYFENVRIK